MLKAFDWSGRMGTYCMIFGGLVLTIFWPDFSQQSLISSKDKSRDDLQQNLQISVNAISVLLSNENYTSNELNALLIGEGGLIQDWFKVSQDEQGTNAWVEFVSENLESVWMKYFYMGWKQVASEQIMLGTPFVTQGNIRIKTTFTLDGLNLAFSRKNSPSFPLMFNLLNRNSS